MRHAKSSWKSDAPSDHARPLNKRGRRAAPAVARALRRLGWIPEQVISSDAQRTRETWARCAPELPAPAALRFDPTLYFGRFDHVLAALAGASDDHGTLLALGHNPMSERLVGWLCGAGVVMKTADAALLEAPIERWRDGFVAPGAWTLSCVVRAREVTAP